MKCSVAKQLMSAYLDGAVSRQEMAEIQGHLRNCAACGARFESLQRAQRMVSSLGRKQAPPELVLRLRVALSQEVANSRRSRLESLRIRWENLLDAIMVPATAGLVTTIIIFGLLMSFLVPGQMTASNDVPTMLYTPPQLEFAPFEMTMGVANAESLVVEAYVGADGRVQDYRILSGAEDAAQFLPDLKNMLIFTTFHPATSFGRPTAGRAILSFSNVHVKG